EDYELNKDLASSNSYRLRVAIPNTEQTLLPGMSAQIHLITSKPYQALRIHRSSLLQLTFSDDSVLIVNEKKILEQRKHVRIRPYVMNGNGNGASKFLGIDEFVIEAGLSPEDWIVVNSWKHKRDVGSLVQTEEILRLQTTDHKIENSNAETS